VPWNLRVFIAVCITLPVDAQAGSRLGQPAATPPAVLTGKERLGRKWMDEQRIDNCNVPIDKRGPKPRPSSCSYLPMGLIKPTGAAGLNVTEYVISVVQPVS
jgi:hypothetical protein